MVRDVRRIYTLTMKQVPLAPVSVPLHLPAIDEHFTAQLRDMHLRNSGVRAYRDCDQEHRQCVHIRELDPVVDYATIHLTRAMSSHTEATLPIP